MMIEIGINLRDALISFCWAISFIAFFWMTAEILKYGVQIEMRK